MIVLIRKRRLCAVGLAIASLLVAAIYFTGREPGLVAALHPCRMEETTVIIDPGHGGEDGGAISASGQVESELNLSIGLRLDSLMAFYGVNTMMTRREDLSLHDSDADTLRKKKVSDLHNRVAMVEETAGATLISIHQNSYPQQRYHGLQVFYADVEGSIELATQIQNTVSAFLDPENNRKPAKIPDSVYLMNNISCRAILVECGFLSNPSEAEMLQQESYQIKVAMTIAAACFTE